MENFPPANCTKWKILQYLVYALTSMLYILKIHTTPSLFFRPYSLLSTEQPIGGTHAVDCVAIFGYGTRFAIHGYER